MSSVKINKILPRSICFRAITNNTKQQPSSLEQASQCSWLCITRSAHMEHIPCVPSTKAFAWLTDGMTDKLIILPLLLILSQGNLECWFQHSTSPCLKIISN